MIGKSNKRPLPVVPCQGTQTTKIKHGRGERLAVRDNRNVTHRSRPHGGRLTSGTRQDGNPAEEDLPDQRRPARTEGPAGAVL
jgi:hypothetical protein